MRRLVALDLPGGEAFVEALQRCFDDGDAVWPVDRRLPGPARTALFAALLPAAVIDESGEHRLSGGLGVEDGDAVVIPTSGTTGTQKGVVLTHEALRASALATSARLEVDPLVDRWVCCLPLAHVGGLSVVLRALVVGAGLEVHDRFDPDRLLAALGGGANLVSLVPTMLYRLGTEAAGFRRIVLGGSAPPEAMPANAVATYGMTETGSGVVYNGWPLDGVEVRIVDGEVQLRGPMLLRGYRDGTSPLDPEGWLATGDAGELSNEGRLSVFGRIADVVVTGGEKVWPAAVEALLEKAPGVGEVAIGGVPDPEWGERVVAYVVPSSGAEPPRLDQLRGAVRDRLGPWAAPKELVLVEALPRTAIGKVRRRALADLANGASRSGDFEETR